MAKYEIDTDKLESASFEIKTILSNLDRTLTDYMQKMARVPNETKEWQGNACEDFVSIIKDDFRNEYMPLMNVIRKYADEMQQEALEYKSVPSSNVL